MAYEREKDYVREETNRGVSQFGRSNPYVRTLLDNQNLSDVAAFVREQNLDSRTY